MTPRAPDHRALVHPPETSVRSKFPEPFPSTMPALGTTNPFPLHPPSLSVAFRHSGWTADRNRVYLSLQRTRQTASRQTAFATCGDRAYVYQTLDEPPAYRVMGSACHDRFCAPCTRERGQKIAACINAKLDGQRCRFVTLTLRTEGLDLAAGMLKLQHAFRRLLRTTLWQGRVSGGVAFLEVKWNSDSARWHPHIHAIVQGKYIPHDLLKRAWHAITGDSHVVRLQSIRNADKVLRYVTTYAAKTLRTADFPTDAVLDEAVHVLHGTRLVRTFGTWRGLNLNAPPDDSLWIILAPLADLLHLALTGDFDARRVIAALPGSHPLVWLADHPPGRPALSARPGALPRTQTTFDFPPCPCF